MFGLPDLFFDYGQAHSAAELYQFYTKLRVFAYTRANTRPKTTDGAVEALLKCRPLAAEGARAAARARHSVSFPV